MRAKLVSLVLTLVLAGLLGATLVRFAPGYGVDEHALDPRLSRESVEALQNRAPARDGLLRYYAGYLQGLLRGDLGESGTLNRPVAELIRERMPVTARSIGLGLALAWSAGLALALLPQLFRSPVLDWMTAAAAGVFLCAPAAVVALAALHAEAPTGLALAAVIFPRVFRYARNLLAGAAAMPHVLAAEARGLGRVQILGRHILPLATPQLLSLLGVSLNLAFGASIPVEAVCGSPGLGQMAWQAALGRDLPVLVNMTLLLAALTMISNFLAEAVTAKCVPVRA